MLSAALTRCLRPVYGLVHEAVGIPAMSLRPRVAAGLLGLILAGLSAGGPRAQTDTPAVNAMLRDLASDDFDRAYQAAEGLGKHPAHKAQIVAALIEAIRTRDWSRCAGDVRDTIARTLGGLGARESVGPLLEVVRSGKSIEHECLE
jgi:HEAT repeat protein